jgi:hypothetical protein
MAVCAENLAPPTFLLHSAPPPELFFSAPCPRRPSAPANPDLKCTHRQHRSGCTPLYEASKNGDVKISLLLIEAKAAVGAKDAVSDAAA